MPPLFFATPAQWRSCLTSHHAREQDLWVGFYKRDSGRPSITWPEAVDQALCFGWIDGVRRTVDETSYMIRFTPRRRGSIWSAVNTRRALELIEAGLMRPLGLKAFAARNPAKSGVYSFERGRGAKLPPAQEQQFRQQRRAWEFFQAQPPWYRRTASFWVISAKKEETRLRRLALLIAESANGLAVGPLRRKGTTP